jgi:hypothetical protein
VDTPSIVALYVDLGPKRIGSVLRSAVYRSQELRFDFVHILYFWRFCRVGIYCSDKELTNVVLDYTKSRKKSKF